MPAITTETATQGEREREGYGNGQVLWVLGNRIGNWKLETENCEADNDKATG